ncbi:MAG TPA: hypothetical protein VNZ52_04595, partial [Candidatus Thermoplasmatota archaeon]|nr:hypothetical protein [Candidatus Thermoplasmatota archaeon]
TPSAQTIRVALEDRNKGEHVVTGSGQSPLIIEFPKGKLVPGEEYSVRPSPEPPGVWKDQRITFRLELV